LFSFGLLGIEVLININFEQKTKLEQQQQKTPLPLEFSPLQFWGKVG